MTTSDLCLVFSALLAPLVLPLISSAFFSTNQNILATISYEARALGIPKLSTVSGALKLCPSLILVNGEDLSFFRKLSREVFMIVRRILWNFGEKMNMEQRHRLEEFTLGEKRVEKLGMDELWIDVS